MEASCESYIFRAFGVVALISLRPAVYDAGV